VIENIWIVILGVGALALLGYLVAFLSSKFDLRPRVKRRFLLPEAEEEARARYRAAWRKYRRLRLELPLSVPGWLVFAMLLSGLFRLFGWNEKIATVFILAYIPYTTFVFVRWNDWQCPRCGQPFKWGGDLFFPKHCHYCNLPMWAESPDECAKFR
jgi:hypothetical protein